MTSLLRFVIGAAGLIAPATVLAQAAALQPAGATEIVGAVSSCVAAVKPGSTDDAVLLAQGWQKGTPRDAKGAPVTTPLNIYGKQGARVLVMTANSAQGCTVLARIESTGAATGVVRALSTELKTEPKQDKDKNLFWFSGTKIIQLTTTGDAGKPALRITVAQPAQKASETKQ